jgi:hypothetical protein
MGKKLGQSPNFDFKKYLVKFRSAKPIRMKPKMSNYRVIFSLTTSLTVSSMIAFAAENTTNGEEKNVIYLVNQAKAYIQQHGKNRAIEGFKKSSSMIYAIDFKGMILASPIHPETVGTNQIHFKDPSGALVVQEEIDKAMAGGGWLKGRYRKNHKTGQHECRKLYILPMKGNYFIGSWYYYAANKIGKCLV